MIDIDNKYSKMQKNFYDSNATKMAQRDHAEHNDNPNYWDILLGDISDDMFEDDNEIKALDFGCGTGRNVKNLLKDWNWKRVDGIDISENNIIEAKKNLIKLRHKEYEEGHTDSNRFKFHSNNGIDLLELKDNEYNFIMSTIVFQHISVYEIRLSLLRELYRVLKIGGIFSFQMGYNHNPKYNTVTYFENYYDATSTNSDCNVRVDNEEDIKNDLKKIGFKNIQIIIKDSFSDDVHPKWIYVKAVK